MKTKTTVKRPPRTRITKIGRLAMQRDAARDALRTTQGILARERKRHLEAAVELENAKDATDVSRLDRDILRARESIATLRAVFIAIDGLEALAPGDNSRKLRQLDALAADVHHAEESARALERSLASRTLRIAYNYRGGA